MLEGYWTRSPQGVGSQSSPGATHTPQLGLQQPSPAAQVMKPQLSPGGAGPGAASDSDSAAGAPASAAKAEGEVPASPACVPATRCTSLSAMLSSPGASEAARDASSGAAAGSA